MVTNLLFVSRSKEDLTFIIIYKMLIEQILNLCEARCIICDIFIFVTFLFIFIILLWLLFFVMVF